MIRKFIENAKTKAAIARAARSAAQAAILTIGADAAIGGQVSIWGVDWSLVAGFSGGMAVMSLLTSLVAGLPEAES